METIEAPLLPGEREKKKKKKKNSSTFFRLRFSDAHAWTKPSDDRALRLADRAAQEVAATVLGGECVVGYGQSDEFSFVLRRETSLFGRRASKLATVAASTFAAAYTRFWPLFFPGTPLTATPAFDGRAVPYPSTLNLRHYLAWRQADCHVNCQYNACFWALVDRGGVGRTEAAAELKVEREEEKKKTGGREGVRGRGGAGGGGRGPAGAGGAGPAGGVGGGGGGGGRGAVAAAAAATTPSSLLLSLTVGHQVAHRLADAGQVGQVERVVLVVEQGRSADFQDLNEGGTGSAALSARPRMAPAPRDPACPPASSRP